MVCIVSGFPSNIAALQLEWALHNPHLTRHIDHDKRISFAVTQIKTNRKTGRTRRKPARPTTSLLEKLSNLHLLLRAPYFSKWPLEVRFFSEDVFKSWQSWCGRVDEQVHPSIKVTLDLPKRHEIEDEDITSGQKPKKRRKLDLIGQGGIEGIDPTYEPLQDVLHKGRFILDQGDGQQCTICSASLNLATELYTVCPRDRCHSLNHVRCMSQHFLGNETSAVVPKVGTCPLCGGELQWLDLMKEVSVRGRNPKEVGKVLKKRQKLLAKANKDAPETDTDEDLDDESEVEQSLVAEEEHDDEDARSDVSMDSFSSVVSRAIPSSPAVALAREEIVIADSDDDR